MPYINVASPNTKAEAMEAIGVTAGPSQGSLVVVQTVDPVTHLRSAKHMAKNVFIATKRNILANFVSPNIRASHLDQM